MTKILTVYRKNDGSIITKVHRSYNNIHTKNEVNYIKKRIAALLVVAERIY